MDVKKFVVGFNLCRQKDDLEFAHRNVAEFARRQRDSLREFETELLPGVWALFHALGLFASRLHLPRAVGWVGLWYLAAGGWLLGSTPL